MKKMNEFNSIKLINGIESHLGFMDTLPTVLALALYNFFGLHDTGILEFAVITSLQILYALVFLFVTIPPVSLLICKLADRGNCMATFIYTRVVGED